MPVFLFPSHYKEGARAICSLPSENAATSLINGVHDTRCVGILFSSADQVYRVANQLRHYHMDMFRGRSAGLDREKGRRSIPSQTVAAHEGTCRIDAYVTGDDGATAARVTGWVLKNNNKAPRDWFSSMRRGIICGIARDFRTAILLTQILDAKSLQGVHSLVTCAIMIPPDNMRCARPMSRHLPMGVCQSPEPAKNIPSF